MDQKIETTDAQRIFVCQNLGWKDHIQGEPFGQMVDIFEKYKVVCRYLPPLTLDWLYECWLRLDGEKNILSEDVGFQTQRDCFVENLERVVLPTCAEDDIYINTVNASKEQRLAALVATLRL